jgi:hypothetical protein
MLVILRMQYTLVTMEKFNPFRRTILVTWSLLIANIIFVLKFNQSLMDEAFIFRIIIAFSVISMSHMILSLISEMKEILGIDLFLIKKFTPGKIKEGKSH